MGLWRGLLAQWLAQFRRHIYVEEGNCIVFKSPSKTYYHYLKCLPGFGEVKKRPDKRALKIFSNILPGGLHNPNHLAKL